MPQLEWDICSASPSLLRWLAQKQLQPAGPTEHSPSRTSSREPQGGMREKQKQKTTNKTAHHPHTEGTTGWGTEQLQEDKPVPIAATARAGSSWCSSSTSAPTQGMEQCEQMPIAPAQDSLHACLPRDRAEPSPLPPQHPALHTRSSYQHSP